MAKVAESVLVRPGPTCITAFTPLLCQAPSPLLLDSWGNPPCLAILELLQPRVKFHRLCGGLEYECKPPLPWAIFFEGMTEMKSKGSRQSQRCSQHGIWKPHADHAKWGPGVQPHSGMCFGTRGPERGVNMWASGVWFGLRLPHTVQWRGVGCCFCCLSDQKVPWKPQGYCRAEARGLSPALASEAYQDHCGPGHGAKLKFLLRLPVKACLCG